jgi:predicted transcriptional regulator of viral defense system
MKKEPQNIEQNIFNKMKKAKPSTLFFIEQFSELAEPAAIRKALQRLKENEKIVRVAQGIYVIPKESKLVGKIIPGAEEVIAAIAKKDQFRIVPTGIQAQHLLGLTTQVPMKLVYLTDSAPRTVNIGKQTVALKKTTPKNLIAKGEISGLVIQALKTIGKNKLDEKTETIILERLKNEKTANIIHDSKLAPAWIASILKKAIANE